MSKPSARVSKKSRAGRAPYNFVPPPDNIRWKIDGDDEEEIRRNEEAYLLDHNRYHEGRLSGVIDLEIEAVSDYYIRGMWPLCEFEQGKELKEPQVLPFMVDGNVRLPGSSLRGMIRTLVEILSNAPLDPVDDRPLFFRAIGDKADPNVDVYRRLICPNDPRIPEVQAGYLYADGPNWKIQPAKRWQGTHQWFRAIPQGKADWGRALRVVFRPEPPPAVVQEWETAGVEQRSDQESGWLVQSGRAPRKEKQWIIMEADEGAPVELDDAEVALHRDDTTADKRSRLEPGKSAREGRPCFYTEWTDPREAESSPKRTRILLGHTPYFRMPCSSTPQQVNPARRDQGEPRWDLAQAIFGRTSTKSKPGRRGRVCIEDAVPALDSTESIGSVVTTVLSGPKPTTFQHYLRQECEIADESIGWNSEDRARELRGHKLYWHRPVDLREERKRTDSTTSFQPVRKGARFQARVRYENLDEVELGALLGAIELREDCLHKLGMGKPLGMGSFKITAELREISREERYAGLFGEGKESKGEASLVTGLAVEPADRERRLELLDRFAAWVLDCDADSYGGAWDRLWDRPRSKELLALLRDRVAGGHEWKNATRYLRLGKLSQGEGTCGRKRRSSFNEYVSRYDWNERQSCWQERSEPRRPLPPATQVAELDENTIPTDEPPDA